MPTVWILVERTEGGWTATARDEVGTLTSRTSNLRSEAIRRVKFDAARLMGRACRFRVDEIGEGR